MFMMFFLDDFIIFSDLKTHLVKLQLCFNKCQKFNINLNLEKKCFWCFPMSYLVTLSKEGKLSDPKKL
jgi:hypothetical protein